MATLFSCEYAWDTLLVQVSPASGMHWARPHKKFTGDPFETFWLAVLSQTISGIQLGPWSSRVIRFVTVFHLKGIIYFFQQ